MHRILILSLLLFNLACLAQQKTLITQVGSSKQANKIYYVINSRGDSLSIKNNYETHLYQLISKGQTLYLVIDSDTLIIDFDDIQHVVKVNQDAYQLFSNHYTYLKHLLLVKHSVMAAIYLLEDNIGNYQIEATLPLLLFEPQTGKRIQKAQIITHRSQSDVIDSWNCIYYYNADGRLNSILATDDSVTRFKKTIVYKNSKITWVQTYRNIEERQITKTLVSYALNHLQCHEETLETGKNRTTKSMVVLRKPQL